MKTTAGMKVCKYCGSRLTFVGSCPKECKGMTDIEFDVLIDHLHAMLRRVYEEKGAWYVRTLIARWLEDMDEEHT